MCRGTPGLLIIALPADLRASIPEPCPLSGQVNPPRLRLRGESANAASKELDGGSVGVKREEDGETEEVELRACGCQRLHREKRRAGGRNTYRAAPDLRACPDHLQEGAGLCMELSAPP